MQKIVVVMAKAKPTAAKKAPAAAKKAQSTSASAAAAAKKAKKAAPARPAKKAPAAKKARPSSAAAAAAAKKKAARPTFTTAEIQRAVDAAFGRAFAPVPAPAPAAASDPLGALALANMDPAPGSRAAAQMEIVDAFVAARQAAGFSGAAKKIPPGVAPALLADLAEKARRVEAAVAGLSSNEEMLSQMLLTSGPAMLQMCYREIREQKILKGRRPQYIVCAR